MPMPAVEAVMIMREGDFWVAFASRRGANLTWFRMEVNGVGNRIQYLHSYGIEHALHIQIHYLPESGIRMSVELLTPGSAGISEEDVHMICCLPDLSNEVLNSRELCRVGGDGDSTGVGMFVGEGVQGFASRFTGGGFAGSDVDFRAAGLE